MAVGQAGAAPAALLRPAAGAPYFRVRNRQTLFKNNTLFQSEHHFSATDSISYQRRVAEAVSATDRPSLDVRHGSRMTRLIVVLSKEEHLRGRSNLPRPMSLYGLSPAN